MADPTDTADTAAGDDHRKHLELIQAVITRMSAASASAKGWLLPVVTAAYGYSVVKREWAVAILGALAVALFGFLDANYLKQERRFRQLYNAVVNRDARVPGFSLDTTLVCPGRPVGPGKYADVRQAIGDWLPKRRDWASWSVAPFYGGLLIAGFIIVVSELAAGPPAPTAPPRSVIPPTVTVVTGPASTANSGPPSATPRPPLTGSAPADPVPSAPSVPTTTQPVPVPTTRSTVPRP